MNEQEALAEARKRWGGSAFVQKVSKDFYPGKRYRVCAAPFKCMGIGDSWESAFLDSDRREMRTA